MKIITLPIGKDNFSYLLICRHSGSVAVIDPSEAQPVLDAVQKEDLNLEWILCTHHHGDHIGGIAGLQSVFPDVKIGGAAVDQGRTPELNQLFVDGTSFQVGNIAGHVIATPGHTAGSVCYQFNNALFTGDTLFGAGCGRLFEGTAAEMFHSLNVKLPEHVDSETKLYFGHEYTEANLRFARGVEPENQDIQMRLQNVCTSLQKGVFSTPSSWSEELDTNPFLRCTQPTVIDSAKRWAPEIASTPTEIFRAIRDWKNHY